MVTVACVLIICCLIGFLAYVNYHNNKLKCQHTYKEHEQHAVTGRRHGNTHTIIYVLKCSKCGILREKRVEANSSY